MSIVGGTVMVFSADISVNCISGDAELSKACFEVELEGI
jgi:hypothetical protein